MNVASRQVVNDRLLENKSCRPFTVVDIEARISLDKISTGMIDNYAMTLIHF